MEPIIVLATRNSGKVAELAATLKDFGLTVRGLDEYPEIGEIIEDGETFEANALIKARTVANATGLVAIADDSGLAVDALNGAPGVYSARYSDDTPGLTGTTTDARNNEKLLQALSGVTDEKRTARFCCVMAAAAPNGAEHTTSGTWEGCIGHEYKGDNGFGYDPLFIDPTDNKHSAELTKAEKNKRSHRGNALAALLRDWPEFWQRANA